MIEFYGVIFSNFKAKIIIFYKWIFFWFDIFKSRSRENFLKYEIPCEKMSFKTTELKSILVPSFLQCSTSFNILHGSFIM